MPRKKKINRFEELLWTKLNELQGKDIIYFLTWGLGVFYVYNTLLGLKGLTNKIIKNPLNFLNLFFGLAGLTNLIFFTPDGGTPYSKETDIAIDVILLAQAMLITYAIMKMDIEDVVTGVTNIATKIGTFGTGAVAVP